MMTSAPAPSRAEAIAAVLDACDGRYGRVLNAPHEAPSGWPTLAWQAEAARIVHALRVGHAGTMWKRGRTLSRVVCDNCGVTHAEHGASREVATRLGIPLERRALICPPVGSRL